MRTMALYESGESNGSISLKKLFAGEKNLSGLNELTLEEIAYLIFANNAG